MKNLKINRKRKLNSYFKIGILLFGILTITTNCENENNLSDQTSEIEQLLSESHKITSIDNLNHLKPIIENLKTIKLKESYLVKNSNAKQSLDNINVNRIIQYTNETGFSTYTFKIENNSESINFENLHLIQTEVGYIGYILSYEPDLNVDFYSQTPEGEFYFDIKKYKGHITKYSLDREIIWTTKTKLSTEKLSSKNTSARSSGHFTKVCITYFEPQCDYGEELHSWGTYCTGNLSYETTETCQTVWVSGELIPQDNPDYEGDGTGGGITIDGTDCSNTSGTSIVDSQPITGISTDCAPNNTVGVTTSATYQSFWMSLSTTQQDFLNQNQLIFNNVLSYLNVNDYAPQAQKFVSNLIDVVKVDLTVDANAFGFALEANNQNKIYNSFDSAFLNSVNQYMAIDSSNSINTDPIYTHFILKCITLRALNPEWSDYEILWEASKDIVHISLDVFGMIPVVGEIADLTNGVLYTIEGDGLNATLSYASAVPVAGWAAMGIKYGLKVVDATQTVYSIGTKVKLVWKIGVDGFVNFGSTGSKLRKVLGMAPYAQDARQAHHIIPWAKQTENVVQQAAKDPRAFHMNEALNGIPLDNSVHLGSHTDYDNKILQKLIDLNNAYPNITPEQAYDGLTNIINNIRTAIKNNPTTHVNNLVF